MSELKTEKSLGRISVSPQKMPCTELHEAFFLLVIKTYPKHKTMKTRLKLLLSAMLLVAAGCGVLQMTPGEKAQIAQAVQDSLDNRSFRINVDRMLPLRGPSRMLNGGWFLRIKEDRFDSHLPYFGVAYSLPYGGGDGLNFQEKILAYQEGQVRPDAREIAVQVKHEQDHLRYVIQVFDNGKCDVQVSSRNRETIRFMGEIHVDYTKF